MTDVVIVDGVEVVILSDTEQEVIEVGVQGPPGLQGLQGDPGAPGVDGVGVPTGGTTGQLLAKATGTDFDTEWVDPPSGGSSVALWNPIINGAFGINQRAASSNTDDTYAHDRWYALTQTGAIAVSTLTNVEDGLPTMARLTQSQVTSQRMGYAQIIEGRNCKHLRGKQVTFRFGRKRMSAAGNIRIAVLEWTGTEDSVTSDVVSSWTSTTYTAGNFFLGSNLTVSGVVQQTLAANTLTDGASVTVTLGSTFNNLIVFAWTEAAAAQSVTLDLGRAQLESGATATAFEFRPYAFELSQCYRYYFRMAPGAINKYLQTGFMSTTTVVAGVTQFPVTMRIAPTSVESSGLAGDYAVDVGGVSFTISGAPSFGSSTTAAIGVVGWTLSSTSTAGFNGLVRTSGSGSAGFLAWPAEL